MIPNPNRHIYMHKYTKKADVWTYEGTDPKYKKRRFKKNRLVWEGNFTNALKFIYLWKVDVPSPKIFINLSWTYEKLHCKGKLYN